MRPLIVHVANIKAALARGGTGAARREANEQVVQQATQGAQQAAAMRAANDEDFAQHAEEWKGKRPEPTTPRENPQHAAKALRGRRAAAFLLVLKLVFWGLFGPSYFNAIPWIAVIIALCVSVPLSLGTKSMIADVILKPGLTPSQREARLHQHVVAGIVAFGIAFGGLFLLRGLAGPLALIGAMLVLPVLSLCDLVLLYLMGIADAYDHLYSWAAPFVQKHQDLTMYLDSFEQYRQASQKRLDNPDENTASSAALPEPTDEGPAGTTAVPLTEPKKTAANTERRTNAATAAALVLATSLLGGTIARAQTPPPTPPVTISTLDVDSTTSIFPSVATTMGPTIAQAFTTWTEKLGAHFVRVSSFERDGWLPHTILQTTMTTPTACAPTQGERAVFRGIGDALDQQARDACNHAQQQETDRITAEITKALMIAWHAPPIVDPRQGPSCTAFKDLLANTARSPTGNLVVIVGDTEETCKNDANPVPDHAAGADVIIILVPSKTDMGPGVSAASRFAAKKAYLEKIAPWLRAILAPADVELYRLPIPPPLAPVTKISFWQR